MSDKHRRVLHDWARSQLAPYRTARSITSVKLHDWFPGGYDDAATFEFRINYLNEDGVADWYTATVFPEDMGKLLDPLFALANQDEA